MELDSLYQEVILDHYKHPHNKSLKPHPTIQVHHVNTSCGDEVTLNLHTNGNVIDAITWEGVGCSISQASTSVASDLLKGREITEAVALIEEFQTMVQS
ncbi:MAG: SUF system NifU family Fe-S cluster assembly protein, partial [Actinobacteria bacterium]|nr:SUF system NifU family Fe-S cluster assembly protein [Actinomycetota bacterium]